MRILAVRRDGPSDWKYPKKKVEKKDDQVFKKN